MTTISLRDSVESVPAESWRGWVRAYGLWVGIFLMAAVVRCWGVNHLDVSIDEGHSFLMATGVGGEGDMVSRLQQDTNPPLYFMVLKGWLWVFGPTLLMMRMLSVVCGVGVVAMLGLLAQACGASRRTITWVLFLAALTPLEIHYSQVARGYTLAILLFTMGMYTFLRAVRAEGGRRQLGWWALHGLLVAVGAYENNLLVPMCAGYVIAGVVMRAPRRQWVSMGITYGAAGLAAVPAVMLAMHQQKTSGGMEWIVGFWKATPPGLAMLKSMVILTLGGEMPGYLLAFPLPKGLQWVALGMMGAAVGAFFWPKREGECAARDGLGKNAWFIVVFAAWPLVFLWGYSIFFKPIYLVGRYDLFAQPGLLLVVAAGLSRLQAGATWRGVSAAMGVGVVLVAGVWCRWKAAAEVAFFRPGDRAAYVAKEMGPRDVIVSTGLEATPTMYHLYQRHVDVPVVTFPRETMSHIGWFISDGQIVARKGEWGADAAALLERVEADRRIWVLMDGEIFGANPNFVPSVRLELFLDFMEAARAQGWVPEVVKAEEQGERIGLRVLVLVHREGGVAGAER